MGESVPITIFNCNAAQEIKQKVEVRKYLSTFGSRARAGDDDDEEGQPPLSKATDSGARERERATPAVFVRRYKKKSYLDL
jgi:hypothetical protein